MLERDKDSIKDIIQSNPILKAYSKAFYTLSKEVTSNLSSTYVREKIKEGKSIAYLMPEEVMTYILENKLYQ